MKWDSIPIPVYLLALFFLITLGRNLSEEFTSNSNPDPVPTATYFDRDSIIEQLRTPTATPLASFAPLKEWSLATRVPLPTATSTFDWERIGAIATRIAKSEATTPTPAEKKKQGLAEIAATAEARWAATNFQLSTVTPGTKYSPSCCKYCSAGKACGDSCIKSSYTCHKGRGCACNR